MVCKDSLSCRPNGWLRAFIPWGWVSRPSCIPFPTLIPFSRRGYVSFLPLYSALGSGSSDRGCPSVLLTDNLYFRLLVGHSKVYCLWCLVLLRRYSLVMSVLWGWGLPPPYRSNKCFQFNCVHFQLTTWWHMSISLYAMLMRFSMDLMSLIFFWCQLNGNVGKVGVTDIAADALGELVFVELPAVGTTFKAG